MMYGYMNNVLHMVGSHGDVWDILIMSNIKNVCQPHHSNQCIQLWNYTTRVIYMCWLCAYTGISNHQCYEQAVRYVKMEMDNISKSSWYHWYHLWKCVYMHVLHWCILLVQYQHWIHSLQWWIFLMSPKSKMHTSVTIKSMHPIVILYHHTHIHVLTMLIQYHNEITMLRWSHSDMSKMNIDTSSKYIDMIISINHTEHTHSIHTIT